MSDTSNPASVARVRIGFWMLHGALPAETKVAARKAYGKFLQNPGHPSLYLERLAFEVVRRDFGGRLTL